MNTHEIDPAHYTVDRRKLWAATCLGGVLFGAGLYIATTHDVNPDQATFRIPIGHGEEADKNIPIDPIEGTGYALTLMGMGMGGGGIIDLVKSREQRGES